MLHVDKDAKGLAKYGLYWKTSEGQIIAIEDMEPNHALNCFKMIFNHMVQCYRTDRLMKVADSKFYQSMERWCNEHVNDAFLYMEGFSKILMKKYPLLSADNREYFERILEQMIPYYKDNWSGKLKQLNQATGVNDNHGITDIEAS